MSNISLLKQEKGSTVIVFLFIMSMLAALAVGALQMTSLNLESSGAHLKGKQAYYASEVGLDVAVNAIITQYQNLNPYTTSAAFGGNPFITSNNYRNHSVQYNITNPLAKYLYQTVVGNGIIYHYAHTFDIQAQSTSLVDNSRETLREKIRILETPLVQYYIFYAGTGNAADLEILPGPTMNSWGRIHANGNIYIGTNSAFNLRNYDTSNNLSPHFISAGGQIFSFRKNNGNAYANANVTVKIGNPGTTVFNPTRVIPLGGILDGNEVAEESNFNNYVLINEQQYQAPNQAQFLRNGFYEGRAGNPQNPGVDGITIVGRPADGGIQVFVSRPTFQDVTAQVLAGIMPSGAPNITPPVRDNTTTGLQPNKLCEDREGQRFVDFTDIDLFLLGQWYDDYLTNLGLTLAGDGMLIYTSRSPTTTIPFPNTGARFDAIRLIKMGGSPAQLWDETTIATDNPIYIQGDFNTVNVKGVALVSDAINILSNQFDAVATTKPCFTPITNATQTTINAAFFGGNIPTPAGGGIYSGGLENYPRFHERWTGINCNIRGSFINLWTSTQAVGTWSGGINRYTPPNRTWGWDVRFGNPDFWPPFIPSIFSVERVGFLE